MSVSPYPPDERAQAVHHWALLFENMLETAVRGRVEDGDPEPGIGAVQGGMALVASLLQCEDRIAPYLWAVAPLERLFSVPGADIRHEAQGIARACAHLIVSLQEDGVLPRRPDPQVLGGPLDELLGRGVRA